MFSRPIGPRRTVCYDVLFSIYTTGKLYPNFYPEVPLLLPSGAWRWYHLVTGVGLEPTTFSLWRWQATNCSTPWYKRRIIPISTAPTYLWPKFEPLRLMAVVLLYCPFISNSRDNQVLLVLGWIKRLSLYCIFFLWLILLAFGLPNNDIFIYSQTT